MQKRTFDAKSARKYREVRCSCCSFLQATSHFNNSRTIPRHSGHVQSSPIRTCLSSVFNSPNVLVIISLKLTPTQAILKIWVTKGHPAHVLFFYNYLLPDSRGLEQPYNRSSQYLLCTLQLDRTAGLFSTRRTLSPGDCFVLPFPMQRKRCTQDSISINSEALALLNWA